VDVVDRLMHRLSATAAVIAGFAAAAIMLVMVVDVSTRLFRGSSIPGAVELVETLLTFAIFLSLAAGERRRTHVRVQLLTSSAPPRIGDPLRVLGYLVATAVTAVMTHATFERAQLAVERKEFTWGLVQFPTWPGRVAVPIGLALLTLELLLSTSRAMGSAVKSWRRAERTDDVDLATSGG
jgi:TRAP-type C4-dicarboxylate transport system permease small subunit